VSIDARGKRRAIMDFTRFFITGFLPIAIAFLAIISFVPAKPGVLSRETLKTGCETFQGGYVGTAIERQGSRIRITIEAQFDVKAIGTDVKLMGYECVIEQEDGKTVSGPDSVFMPVWPSVTCEKPPGMQTSFQVIELPISELQNIEHIIKIRVFVVEGAIIEKPFNWTHRVTQIANPSGIALPEPPIPKDTIIDLSNARTVLYSDSMRFLPTSDPKR